MLLENRLAHGSEVCEHRIRRESAEEIQGLIRDEVYRFEEEVARFHRRIEDLAIEEFIGEILAEQVRLAVRFWFQALLLQCFLLLKNARLAACISRTFGRSSSNF